MKKLLICASLLTLWTGGAYSIDFINDTDIPVKFTVFEKVFLHSSIKVWPGATDRNHYSALIDDITHQGGGTISIRVEKVAGGGRIACTPDISIREHMTPKDVQNLDNKIIVTVSKPTEPGQTFGGCTITDRQ